MKMTEGLKTVKDKVGNLLEKYPELRDSDKLLWLAYLNAEHKMRNVIGEAAYIRLKAIVLDENTPTMESIRRIRQKYQEDGLYVGEKRGDRLKEADKVKDWARSAKSGD
jgi:hypothetical protein